MLCFSAKAQKAKINWMSLEEAVAAQSVAPKKIIMDVYTTWCGPCKSLMPMLEKLVDAEAGAVKLVKINVDDEKGIAQQLRVMGIPAVFAFKDGKPVDMFKGAQPESQVKAFIDKHKKLSI